MKREFTYPSKDNETTIHASAWVPESTVKAVLQIFHGMDEYMGRYDDFGNFMAGQGFYVVGNDHLGHGHSVRDNEHLGFFHEGDGNECLLGDLHTLADMTRTDYPDVPYMILGHSMGSFLARQYICRYGNELTAAIIMGTGSQPAATLTLAKTITKLITAFKGAHHRSTFIDGLAFGAYNKKFEPARTAKDWLTKDTAIVDKYLADPWCTFLFTTNAYYHMFRSIEDCQDPARIAAIPKDLPILVTSGEKDPVGNMGRDPAAVADTYRKAGITDVSLKLYPGDRHEILNELDREQVYQDILKWLNEKGNL